MHILENVPDFWHMYRPVMFLVLGIGTVLALSSLTVALKSYRKWDHPAVSILLVLAMFGSVVGIGATSSYFEPKPLEKAAGQLQKEADEQYGISLTKLEAQKMVDPRTYSTTAVKKCSNNSFIYDPNIQPECNNVFEDRDNPDSNYHRFGHVQIATIKGEKVSLTSIELVRLNDEYRLAYYGKNSEKNTIRELPHL